ncbi:MAG: LemA family protein [Deltaproteobacteria bacterium]|nr:LemA family protein [Deltaproteobacteria bacterium]NND29735.1 LemA family protein [Myxococcales bacterium]MBT8466535.1 LemA family protein [Deltaproteobacteria bacterium]MBT8481688.1 LemA family protein [Deltaproteobacteria bacterium]NNK06014.1 LemA family protein [Myxococcales bacterium]
MSKGVIGCGVIAVIALILLATGVGSYNRLVQLEEGVDNAWSQVENVYQRRADLIPNLVAAVKGAKEFEQETLTRVVEARAKVGQVNFETAPNTEQLQQFEAAQTQLSSALSRLLVVVERYPELKATEAFRDLQAQLEGTENRISVERKRFNDATLDYNKTRRQFPTILLANIMGFGDKPYFESTPGADEPPKVEF